MKKIPILISQVNVNWLDTQSISIAKIVNELLNQYRQGSISIKETENETNKKSNS